MWFKDVYIVLLFKLFLCDLVQCDDIRQIPDPQAHGPLLRLNGNIIIGKDKLSLELLKNNWTQENKYRFHIRQLPLRPLCVPTKVLATRLKNSSVPAANFWRRVGESSISKDETSNFGRAVRDFRRRWCFFCWLEDSASDGGGVSG